MTESPRGETSTIPMDKNIFLGVFCFCYYLSSNLKHKVTLMSTRADALILPADTPVSEVEIKKALLFFDSVTLPNPADYALVNEGEICETFPTGHKVTWTARNNFPRTTEYQEKMLRLINDTQKIQKNGLIRITSSTPMNYLDPGINWALWHSAITNIELVEAAVPDRFISETPVLDGIIGATISSLNGYQSKYDILELPPSAMLADANEYWSDCAHLRIGRFLKFVRYSHGLNLIPLATDEPNQNMLATASSTRDLLLVSENLNQNHVDLPKLALQLDIINANALNDTLKNMTWHEVIRLRKEILPGMHLLRTDLNKAINAQRNISANSLEKYNEYLISLAKDYQEKREKLAEEWEKLRIGAICKFGGAAAVTTAADVSGLVAITTGAPWVDLLIKIFSTGLIASSALSDQLSSLIPAQRAVKKHSMYFIDKLPK